MLIAVVLGAGAVGAQEQPTVTESRGLRVVWTVQPQTRDFTAVCGQIFNDQRTTARNVGLLVQSVEGEKVVSRNIPNVAREIVGQSGWQFCGTVVRSASYRVIITNVEWDNINMGQ
ncbi:MAG TPA: hypothetical protein VFS78_21675 [Vicinamibacteria bacterium]|nr:hypothetical protein [Vicinamibacteria bacterium]